MPRQVPYGTKMWYKQGRRTFHAYMGVNKKAGSWLYWVHFFKSGASKQAEEITVRFADGSDVKVNMTPQAWDKQYNK